MYTRLNSLLPQFQVVAPQLSSAQLACLQIQYRNRYGFPLTPLVRLTLACSFAELFSSCAELERPLDEFTQSDFKVGAVIGGVVAAFVSLSFSLLLFLLLLLLFCFPLPADRVLILLSAIVIIALAVILGIPSIRAKVFPFAFRERHNFSNGRRSEMRRTRDEKAGYEV